MRPSVTVPPEVQWLRTDPEVVVVTIEPEAIAVPVDTSDPARRARGNAGGVGRGEVLGVWSYGDVPQDFPSPCHP